MATRCRWPPESARGLRSRYGSRPSSRAASLTRLLDLLLVHLLQLQAEADVVVDAEVGVERVALEDHGDVAVARRHVVDDPVADLQLALRDLLEPGHHPQRGRLAAPGRADQNEELAVLDTQVQIVDRPRSVGIDLRHSLECDPRHGADYKQVVNAARYRAGVHAHRGERRALAIALALVAGFAGVEALAGVAAGLAGAHRRCGAHALRCARARAGALRRLAGAAPRNSRAELRLAPRRGARRARERGRVGRARRLDRLGRDREVLRPARRHRRLGARGRCRRPVRQPRRGSRPARRRLGPERPRRDAARARRPRLVGRGRPCRASS